VRRGKAVVFGEWKSRPGTGSLHPVAIGAGSRSNEAARAFGAEGRYGDSARVHAVTRVNAEPPSQRVMQARMGFPFWLIRSRHLIYAT